MDYVKKTWRGVLACLAVAVPAWYLGKLIPVVGSPVFAILAGVVISVFWKEKGHAGAGIAFTSKKVLQCAVVLLGFGMNLSDILMRGRQSLPIILATITTALLLGYIMYRLLRVSKNAAILVSVGSSICGGSAIAAAAPVIGADDDEIAQSISVIFLFNVIAALVFPALGGMLGLSDEGFAIFAGTAVNDTSSVTAAATAWDGLHGANTLEVATVVKLTRTLAIIPITMVLALVRARENKGAAKIRIGKVFPMFVLLFVLASVVTTLFHLPTAVTAPLKDLSKFFITMAMAAVGFNTNIVKLIKTGLRPVFMGFSCWIGITVVSLLMQQLLGIM